MVVSAHSSVVLHHAVVIVLQGRTRIMWPAPCFVAMASIVRSSFAMPNMAPNGAASELSVDE